MSKTAMTNTKCTRDVHPPKIKQNMNKFIRQKVINQRNKQYTASHKKPCHFVFDNNSGVSWSIFILFVPVKTGRNTVQFTYLMAW